MKKAKAFHIAWIMVLAIVFVSCEGNTDWTWYIENDSSGTIEVHSVINLNDIDSIQFIPSGVQREIATMNMRGGRENPGSPSASMVSLVILNEEGDTILKDPKIDGNWFSNSIQRKKIPSQWEHDFHFQVFDVDFE